MKIHRLKITNYRGVSALDETIPDNGAIASGGNAKGKTTILRAIRAALCGLDIGPDAIRIGADRAEILIDLDDKTVKRVIGPKKSTVSVLNAGGKTADDVIASKQSFLNDLVGGAALDPLDLFLAKPKDRRAKILAVLPIKISLAELREFAPDIPLDFNVSAHGLEVLEAARKRYYDLRTEANRDAKKAEEDAAAAKEAADAATADDGINVPACILAADDAGKKLERLRAQARDAELANERTKSTRDRVAKLREDAAQLEATPGVEASLLETAKRSLVAAQTESTLAESEVERLELALREARARADERRRALSQAEDDLAQLHERERRHADVLARAKQLRSQADELETAIAAVGSAPTAVEIAKAEADLKSALDVADRAKAVEAGRLARAKAIDAEVARKAAEKKAKDLDAIVKRLTNEAPEKLLSSAGAIPGLSLDGDEVMLDGKRLDALSGAEQMDFAIEIAKRAHAKSKILVVDGLERLDPQQFERFVRKATADGFQLLATRVSSGDLTIEHINIDDDEDSEAAQ